MFEFKAGNRQYCKVYVPAVSAKEEGLALSIIFAFKSSATRRIKNGISFSLCDLTDLISHLGLHSHSMGPVTGVTV